MKAVVLIGPPGSGKGTQGRILGEIPGYHLVSMGEILRSVDRDSEPGQTIQSHQRSGELVPSELVLAAFNQYIDTLDIESGTKRLILDGVPRNMEQAEAFQSRLDIARIIQSRPPAEPVA